MSLVLRLSHPRDKAWLGFSPHLFEMHDGPEQPVNDKVLYINASICYIMSVEHKERLI